MRASSLKYLEIKIGETTHKLFCGDCIEVMDNLIEEGVKVTLIIADPPLTEA